MSDSNFPYLHGFSKEEQLRLLRQAEFGEFKVYRNIDFSETEHLLEVGCGVGGQSAILMRRFPKLQLTGIDLNDQQLATARDYLSQQPIQQSRYKILKMDAQNMQFPAKSFDGAFLCWILEHVPDPTLVLSEVRRVLKPGAVIYITEVMNSSFFLDPYSPNLWKYWIAFNDYQHDHAGDPFIGAKLGNLLTAVGYKNIHTKVVTWHYDHREPQKRKEMIEYWCDLLLSGSQQLIDSNYVSQEVVTEMTKELQSVQRNPDAVFMYSFMQANATT